MQIRRKGVIKTRAEINKTKNTKTIEKITGYLRKSQRIDTLLDNTDTETKKGRHQGGNKRHHYRSHRHQKDNN